MDYSIRELRQNESKVLNTFLYEAIFIPEGVPIPPKEIINKLNAPFNAMREYRITQTQYDLYFIFKSKRYMVIVDANKDVWFYDMVPYSCSDLFDSLFRIGHDWPVIDEWFFRL